MIDVDIVVPLCAPSRFHVAAEVARRLAPYHFHHGLITAGTINGEGGKPEAWLVRVPFTPQSAAWGEYVLLRCGYARSGNYVNPKNAAWAYRYTQGAGPWHESSCQDKPKPKTGAPVADAAPRMTGFCAPPTPWSQSGRTWADVRAEERAQPSKPTPRKKRRGLFDL